MQPVRRHLSGAHARPGDVRHLRPAVVRRPSTRGGRRAPSASGSSTRSASTGAARSASRCGPRRARTTRRSAAWWATYLRMGASPGAAVALTQMNGEVDVRHVLPSVRVPTLVLHRRGDRCLLVEEGRYVASRIQGAEFVELEGDDHLPFVGDQNAVLDAWSASYRLPHRPGASGCWPRCSSPRSKPPATPPARGPSSRSPPLRGSAAAWQGDAAHGVRATFDGPARAIRCAARWSRRAALRAAGARSACTPASARRRRRMRGTAVAIAATSARAPPGEVLVSRTVEGPGRRRRAPLRRPRQARARRRRPDLARVRGPRGQRRPGRPARIA